MKKSFYLPDFDGIRDVDTIADTTVLDAALKQAKETMKILSDMIVTIEEQKTLVDSITFTYKIECGRCCHGNIEYLVCVMQIPSDPKLKPFHVDETYTECYSKISAISDAKYLVYCFKEDRGITVEFDENTVE